MAIQQLAVFVENRQGRIKQLTRVLAENGIDLLTLSVADTSDFGILRLITRNNAAAYKVLKAAGFTVSLVDLIGVEVTDEAGGLNKILELLDAEGINIEYLYSFAHTTDKKAVILLRPSDDQKATAALAKHGIRMLEILKY
ncbi:MAG: amino acid-binding protein [Firmicutes bacterium]|nr:amino acid-binding protein [Bacillota bacterium]